MIDSTGGEGGFPVGLSCVHIPSGELQGGPVRGEHRGEDERVFCSGTTEVITPFGPVQHSLGDHWGSVRRWRDGLSLGTGPCLDASRKRTRGEVQSFSVGSARRMRRFLQESEARYLHMGTLTVGRDWSRDPADFRRAVDRWLGYALRELRAEHREHGESEQLASIFWFVEFQSRGAPHLHLFYTRWVHWSGLAHRWHKLCERFGLCGPDEHKFWSTSTRFEQIRGGYRGMLAYATKYARKTEQKQVPTGYEWTGRFWGVRGNRNRGSFHATFTGRSAAARKMRSLQSWLDGLVEQGLVRRFYWEHNEGAVYMPRGGKQWSETEFGAELELRLARIALVIEHENGGA